MKKTLIFVGMLAIGYANAQEGNVGINTETPKATLDIQPNADNAKASATTNQGIIAPKLTKERIANIADISLIDGTLVYATDVTYAGTNAKVAKITEKGYYFYNGTEWVKVQYKENNDAEWVYDDVSKRINLKRSGQNSGFENKVYYNVQTGQKFDILSETTTFENSISDGTSGLSSTPDQSLVATFGAKNMNYTKSSLIPAGYRDGKPYNAHLFYNRLEVDKASSVENQKVSENIIEIPSDNPNNYSSVYNNATVTNLYGTGTVSNSIGLWGQVNVANNQTVTGYTTGILGTSGIFTKGKVGSAYALYGRSFISSASAEVNTLANLLLTSSHLGNDQTLIKSYQGIYNKIDSNSKNAGNGNFIMGIHNAVTHQGQTKYPNMYGIYTNNIISVGSVAPDNNYGIYVTSVAGGLVSNYALYTNAGKVRVGDLAGGTGSKPVFATADGVLTTGASSAIQVGNTDNITCTSANAGTMNYKEVERNGQQIGVFGFCIRRGSDYVWAYMAGGSNIFGTSANGAAFGDGLQ